MTAPAQVAPDTDLASMVNAVFALQCEFIREMACIGCGQPERPCVNPAEWVVVLEKCPIGGREHGVTGQCSHYICTRCKDEIAAGEYTIITNYGEYTTRIIRAERIGGHSAGG